MKLEKYRAGNTSVPLLFTIRTARYQPYENNEVVDSFLHVPSEEVTVDALLELLRLPGINCLEITLEFPEYPA